MYIYILYKDISFLKWHCWQNILRYRICVRNCQLLANLISMSSYFIIFIYIFSVSFLFKQEVIVVNWHTACICMILCFWYECSRNFLFGTDVKILTKNKPRQKHIEIQYFGIKWAESIWRWFSHNPRNILHLQSIHCIQLNIPKVLNQYLFYQNIKTR